MDVYLVKKDGDRFPVCKQCLRSPRKVSKKSNKTHDAYPKKLCTKCGGPIVLAEYDVELTDSYLERCEIVVSKENLTAKPKTPQRRFDELEKVKDEILERVALGTPLRQICREERMPSWSTVYDWIHKDPLFAARFARAREMGCDAIAEETLEIADDGRNDFMEKLGEDEAAGYRINGEHIQRSRLRVETRLKLLAKWAPRKYGEKVAIGGADDLPPIQQNHTLSPDQVYLKVIAGEIVDE